MCLEDAVLLVYFAQESAFHQFFTRAVFSRDLVVGAADHFVNSIRGDSDDAIKIRHDEVAGRYRDSTALDRNVVVDHRSAASRVDGFESGREDAKAELHDLLH